MKFSESKLEEIIAGLWTIAAINAFGYGFNVIGWITAVHAVSCVFVSLRYAFKELKAEAGG